MLTENIALALSGGGFRAAAYSLGVLSYLNHIEFNDHTAGSKKVNLLSKVKYMSSASGGSMTNAFYTLCLAQGKPFAKFYKQILEFMQGEIALKRALEILTDDKAWDLRPDKRRNLINAFAMVYDETALFNKQTIANLKATNTHLEEVCFNSTEFYKGIAFRQGVKLKGGKATARFGNFFIYLKEDISDQLKIADVFAASSCFPAGFEPILFPYDFAYPGLDLDTLKEGVRIRLQSETAKMRQFADEKKFGLMDGGITDNQGLSTLMMADEARMKSKTGFKRFDLIMVNDVGSHYMDPYKEPVKLEIADRFFRRLQKILLPVIIVSAIILIVSIVGASILFLGLVQNKLVHNILLSLSVLVIAFSSLALAVSLIVRNYVFTKDHSEYLNRLADSANLGKNFSLEILTLVIKFLNHSRMNVFLQLLKVRVVSVLVLNNDVFLKHVRRLIFDRFYETPAWQNRRKGNHIYDLSKTNQNQLKSQLAKYDPVEQKLLTPSNDIMEIAESAFNMPTTLWFDTNHVKAQKLKKIVACGQFTTCFNLIQYILDFKRSGCYDKLDLNDPFRARIDEIEKQLKNDWGKFNTLDPYFLF